MLNLLLDAQHKIGDKYYARAHVPSSINVEADSDITKSVMGVDVFVESFITFKGSNRCSNNPRAISEAKHKGVVDLHNMLYGDIIRELKQLQHIAYRDSYNHPLRNIVDNLLTRLEL